MSALARLFYKWVTDDTKSYSIEDVPHLWRGEVEELMGEDEKKASEVIDQSASGTVEDNRRTEPTN